MVSLVKGTPFASDTLVPAFRMIAWRGEKDLNFPPKDIVYYILSEIATFPGFLSYLQVAVPGGVVHDESEILPSLDELVEFPVELLHPPPRVWRRGVPICAACPQEGVVVEAVGNVAHEALERSEAAS